MNLDNLFQLAKEEGTICYPLYVRGCGSKAGIYPVDNIKMIRISCHPERYAVAFLCDAELPNGSSLVSISMDFVYNIFSDDDILSQYPVFIKLNRTIFTISPEVEISYHDDEEALILHVNNVFQFTKNEFTEIFSQLTDETFDSFRANEKIKVISNLGNAIRVKDILENCLDYIFDNTDITSEEMLHKLGLTPVMLEQMGWKQRAAELRKYVKGGQSSEN